MLLPSINPGSLVSSNFLASSVSSSTYGGEEDAKAGPGKRPKRSHKPNFERWMPQVSTNRVLFPQYLCNKGNASFYRKDLLQLCLPMILFALFLTVFVDIRF